MTIFFRIADEAGAGFRALGHLLSILPDVSARFLNTLSGACASLGAESVGKLVSITDGVDGALPTTGAESSAVSSGEFFSGGGDGLGGDAGSASSGTCSGLRTGTSPESGGPGGSRKAVTAVQLSARSLFIIQWSRAVLTSLFDGFVQG